MGPLAAIVPFLVGTSAAASVPAAAAAAVLSTAVIVDALHDSRDCGGYWDVVRIWIPAVTERVWCRSCYTEYTDLGPGCWKEVVVRPGYYEDRRVWVNRR